MIHTSHFLPPFLIIEYEEMKKDTIMNVMGIFKTTKIEYKKSQPIG